MDISPEWKIHAVTPCRITGIKYTCLTRTIRVCSTPIVSTLLFNQKWKQTPIDTPFSWKYFKPNSSLVSHLNSLKFRLHLSKTIFFNEWYKYVKPLLKILWSDHGDFDRIVVMPNHVLEKERPKCYYYLLAVERLCYTYFILTFLKATLNQTIAYLRC